MASEEPEKGPGRKQQGNHAPASCTADRISHKVHERGQYPYENFNEMYQAYHELGGNSMVTKMKKEIDELHLKKKENDHGY